MVPFRLGRRRAAQRRRNQANTRRANRSADALGREARQGWAAAAFLGGKPDEEWRRLLSEPLGAGVCVLGGALAVTLQEILDAEQPLWTEDDKASFSDATSVSTGDPLVGTAGSAFADVFCTDCRQVDWQSAEGQRLTQEFGFLRVLADYVAYEPLDLVIAHWGRHGCPPAILPVRVERIEAPPPGVFVPPAPVRSEPWGWMTRVYCADGSTYLAEFPPTPRPC